MIEPNPIFIFLLYIVYLGVIVYSTKMLLPIITPRVIYKGFPRQPVEAIVFANAISVIGGFVLSYYIFFTQGGSDIGIVNLIYATKTNPWLAFFVGFMSGVLLITIKIKHITCIALQTPTVLIMTILYIPALDITLWQDASFVLATFAKIMPAAIVCWLIGMKQLKKSKIQSRLSFRKLSQKRG